MVQEMSDALAVAAANDFAVENAKRRLVPFSLKPHKPQPGNESAGALVMSIGIASPQDRVGAAAVLNRILDDRVARNNFIHILGRADIQPCPANVVRLCIAIDEYEKTKAKAEKRSKGRKIAAMFAHRGAMFELPDGSIPQELRDALEREAFSLLPKLRPKLIQALATNAMIATILREWE